MRGCAVLLSSWPTIKDGRAHPSLSPPVARQRVSDGRLRLPAPRTRQAGRGWAQQKPIPLCKGNAAYNSNPRGKSIAHIDRSWRERLARGLTAFFLAFVLLAFGGCSPQAGSRQRRAKRKR